MDVKSMMMTVEGDIQGMTRRAYGERRLPIDRDDFAQELRIKVLALCRRWDGEQSQWRSFVIGRLRWLASDVVRAHGYVKRSGARRTADVCHTVEEVNRFERIVEAATMTAAELVDWEDFLGRVETLDRDARMWMDYHVHGLPMKQVARKYSVTEGRVSQILAANGNRIREQMRSLVA